MPDITAAMLRHAIEHRKDCGCDKSEVRDPKCAKDWPDLCPWWAFQLHRNVTGDFSSPEWWAYQLRLREDYSDEPPHPREFEARALSTIRQSRDKSN